LEVYTIKPLKITDMFTKFLVIVVSISALLLTAIFFI